MTDADRVLARASVERWRRLRLFAVELPGGHCPLCEKYLKKTCGRCPVKKATGKDFCEGTPYQAWKEHRSMIPLQHLGPRVVGFGAINGSAYGAALDMADFIEGLLA